MFYYLYQIQNKLNGMIYIGVHKTKNLDDGYMGSGSYLKNAKLKHGIENFEKTILQYFDCDEEMLLAEAALVTDEFLSREGVYNLIKGGLRCAWDEINSKRLNIYGLNGQSGYGLENLCNQPGTPKLIDVLISKGTWEDYKNKISDSILKLYANGYINPFQNRKHSQETKLQIGKANSITQAGNKNSQFGTKWIHSLELKQSKRISKNDLIPDGWVSGRKIKF